MQYVLVKMCTYFTSFITLSIYFLAINIFALFVNVCFFENYLESLIREKVETRLNVYDYIIVGSGSAGSIVAQRLSEDKKLKILLIEAGSDGNRLFDIPVVGPMLQNSPYDWQYRTVPQKKGCLGLQDKVSYWPMGKIVGGTSRINNMIYIRGHPKDFFSWYKNKPNLDYNLDIMPYFKRVESSNEHLMAKDLPFLSNIADNFFKAAITGNYSINKGLESQPGFTFPKAAILNGGRFSSYHRLKKLKTANLEIISNSLVEKVLIKNNYETYGVRFIHLDKYHEVRAKKGVILSAGVIGTPKILMLSGIGPEKHLKNLNITPILNLPVGNNLQDHVTTGFDLILLDVKPDVGISSVLSPLSAFSYFVNSKGPWTTTGCEGLAFFNKSQEIPDIQFMILPLGTTSDNGIYLRSLVGIPDGIWRDYFSKISQPAITILPLVLHPKSRGTLRLKNKNVKSAPLIDPNYLSDDYDVQVLIHGIKKVKEWIKTQPLQELGAKLNNNTFPGCEDHVFDSEAYWECYVRHLTITSYHPVGTCQMGEVVDYDFRVKETNKLWVVDGSVLPDLPSGNPNAAIMMMAEMASDKIKYYQWLMEEKTSAKEVFVEKTAC